MTVNVGSADRLIRIVLGLILVLIPFVTNAGPIVTYGAPIVGVRSDRHRPFPFLPGLSSVRHPHLQGVIAERIGPMTGTT